MLGCSQGVLAIWKENKERVLRLFFIVAFFPLFLRRQGATEIVTVAKRPSSVLSLPSFLFLPNFPPSPHGFICLAYSLALNRRC